VFLYYITDRAALGGTLPLLECVRRVTAAGGDWIQVRERDLSGRALAELVTEVLKIARAGARPTRVLVNDRLDVALATGADGVHLPSHGLPTGAVRRLAPAGLIIGRSCHSPADVQAAAAEGADLCVLGPVFATPAKAAMGPPLGLSAFRSLRDVTIPVLALGGVTLENAASCRAAGAAGLAAIRLFQDGPLPAAELARLRG